MPTWVPLTTAPARVSLWAALRDRMRLKGRLCTTGSLGGRPRVGVPHYASRTQPPVLRAPCRSLGRGPARPVWHTIRMGGAHVGCLCWRSVSSTHKLPFVAGSMPGLCPGPWTSTDGGSSDEEASRSSESAPVPKRLRWGPVGGGGAPRGLAGGGLSKRPAALRGEAAVAEPRPLAPAPTAALASSAQPPAAAGPAAGGWVTWARMTAWARAGRVNSVTHATSSAPDVVARDVPLAAEARSIALRTRAGACGGPTMAGPTMAGPTMAGPTMAGPNHGRLRLRPWLCMRRA